MPHFNIYSIIAIICGLMASIAFFKITDNMKSSFKKFLVWLACVACSFISYILIATAIYFTPILMENIGEQMEQIHQTFEQKAKDN